MSLSTDVDCLYKSFPWKCARLVSKGSLELGDLLNQTRPADRMRSALGSLAWLIEKRPPVGARDLSIESGFPGLSTLMC